MSTMRLHRLHLSSRPWSRTLAMSWPHSQRVAPPSGGWTVWRLRLLINIIPGVGSNEIENDY